jgi:predicted 3-demethylubiquinone-9 3-methyltransferase (glyoxalase superfamily)
MKTTVTPFLMFEGKAEEAMNLYVSAIPDSKVADIKRYGPEGPGAEGSVMIARFTLAGLPVFCIDSSVKHAFTFTPSNSLFVTCASEEELDRIAGVLADGGKWLMPIGNYGFSRKFGWLNDRYGVSWQLNWE